jgi:zinc/manganese transport system ATP-binding protein
MSALLTLDNVTLGYERHPAVHHLSGTVEAGQMLAVVGPNGGGKSTLMRGIVGSMKPMTGRILLHGLDRHDIAVLPQGTQINEDFPISVLEVIAGGLWQSLGAWKRIDATVRGKIDGALSRVGLVGLEDRQVGTLSRGQLQRALFARLLLQEARLILLDEPFTAIDPATTQQLLNLLHDLRRAGATVVAVLHDLDQVRNNFDTTLLLARHAIAWGPTSAVLGEDNLAAAQNLSQAWDDDAARCLWDNGA